MALQSLADAPNTLREYETIYILRPDTINDNVAEVNSRVKTIIEERGGQVLNVDNWGKRKLAYEIQKERKGIYLFWKYLGSPEIVAEFERNMRLLDPVMRYMTIKLDTDVASGSREAEIDGDTYERAATTAADEEELMTGRAADEPAEAEAAAEDEATAEDGAVAEDEAVVEAAAPDEAAEAAAPDEAAEAAAPDEAAAADEAQNTEEEN